MTEYIVFSGHTQRLRGDLLSIAKHLRAIEGAASPALIFACDTGRQTDIDTRGSDTELEQRFNPTDTGPAPDTPKKRGRPKLGVTGREITLLPRHWEWLDKQRGGASATLRRLVDRARKGHASGDNKRLAQDRTQRFISAIAGDLPGYEEATRALYSGDGDAFSKHTHDWPKDIRAFANELATGAFESI